MHVHIALREQNSETLLKFELVSKKNWRSLTPSQSIFVGKSFDWFWVSSEGERAIAFSQATQGLRDFKVKYFKAT